MWGELDPKHMQKTKNSRQSTKSLVLWFAVKGMELGMYPREPAIERRKKNKNQY